MKISRKYMLRTLALSLAVILSALFFFGRGLWERRTSRQTLNAALQDKASTKKILYWYDPMHPAYKSDRPGTAPDCGMALAPMYEGDGAVDDNMIRMSEQRRQALGVQLATVEERELSDELKANGALAVDDRRVTHVHVRTAGWIDEVYGVYAEGYVRKGQPLFSIYSPEMVTAEREYLIAREGVKRLGPSSYAETAQGAHEMLDAARRRLESYDLSESQIRQLNERGEISKTYIVRSPASGFVVERKAYPKTYVDGATDILTIADLSQLWMLANIYESDLPHVRIGAPAVVSLDYMPGKVMRGRIASGFSSVDALTHAAKMRIDIANLSGMLKPGMYATAKVRIEYGRHVVVPENAVLDSGDHQVVYVAHDGAYEPREINVGETVNGWTIVDFGLQKGEQVVAEGNFLLDSESRLRLPAKGAAHD